MDKITKRVGCWACHSLDTIKWGKQCGKQRFQCHNCGIYFTSENIGVKESNELIWLEKWVVHRQTLSEISQESGYSTRTLRYKFENYLNHYPIWTIPPEKAVNLVVDGTYFPNKVCLFVYRENTLQDTLLYRTTTGEYADEIYEDLLNILRLGIVIESITCDGHKSILRAIKQVNKWIKQHNRTNNTKVKPIVIQRCLVHIQRSCLTYIKREHKSDEGQRLRKIAMTMCKIETIEHKELFVNAFNSWCEDTKDYVSQQSYCIYRNRWWRTHKLLYSAYTTLKSALPNMFCYLDNDKIPRTTNCLEGYFSHLKTDIAVHRGLSEKHFRNFLRWYLWFKNKQ